MKFLGAIAGAALTALATPALSDFQIITSEADFVSLIDGKTLTRPLVTLQVDPGGGISGKGAVWAVTGSWQWKEGYFCRSLAWGGDNLGYNCQQVAAGEGRIRFTSDQGRGDSAEFRLQ